MWCASGVYACLGDSDSEIRTGGESYKAKTWYTQAGPCPCPFHE